MKAVPKTDQTREKHCGCNNEERLEVIHNAFQSKKKT